MHDESKKAGFQRALAILNGEPEAFSPFTRDARTGKYIANPPRDVPIVGFFGALLDVKMDLKLQVFEHRQRIAAASSDAARHQLFRQSMHYLREAIVAEIQRWAPKYMDLATNNPEHVGSSPLDWAREQISRVLERFLGPPEVDGTVAFWLIALSGGDFRERHKWNEEPWMRPKRHRTRRCRSASIIREEYDGIVSRLDYALDCALETDQLERLIAGKDSGRSIHPSSPVQPPVGQKISCPAQHPVLTVAEVMQVLRVGKSTVYRWCDEGKLRRSNSKSSQRRSKCLILTESVTELLQESRE